MASAIRQQTSQKKMAKLERQTTTAYCPTNSHIAHTNPKTVSRRDRIWRRKSLEIVRKWCARQDRLKTAPSLFTPCELAALPLGPTVVRLSNGGSHPDSGAPCVHVRMAALLNAGRFQGLLQKNHNIPLCLRNVEQTAGNSGTHDACFVFSDDELSDDKFMMERQFAILDWLFR